MVYINCLSSHDRRTVLNRILEELGAGSSLDRRSVSTDGLSAQLRYVVDEPTVVLDETDQLDNHQVLHKLYGIADLTLALISNDP